MLACLINAVAFEAKWSKEYEYDNLDYGEFNNSDGTCSEVTMMRSAEWQYIEDPHFTGFTKPYKEVGYSYMALLPRNEDPEYMRKAIENLDLTSLFNSKSEENPKMGVLMISHCRIFPFITREIKLTPSGI